MGIMERLYTLVGQIIENAQYIEWNLALMLRCHMILKEFEENDTIPLSVFENVKSKSFMYGSTWRVKAQTLKQHITPMCSNNDIHSLVS